MKYGSSEHRAWQKKMIEKYGTTGEFDWAWMMEQERFKKIFCQVLK